ncbi:MAG: DEAD/DEAH box helicase [Planctomycetes bacterium]|nr:DEAD/DEAH box helicase [Planctomycetota bacterium]
MTSATFAALGLPDRLLRALTESGYSTPTPIQVQAIPALLEGRDLLGIAQTGTGKTAAFALPTLDFLAEERVDLRRGEVRALVLVPTRELAAQVHESFARYGKFLGLRYAVVFGGVGIGPQRATLARGVDVLVATPGRLLDLVGQRAVDLSDVEVFVLDEADRMLDMGFVRDVRKIIAELPEDRQSLLFSATMPAEVVALTQTILRDPIRVEVTPPAKTADRIEQSIYHVAKSDKNALLARLLDDGRMSRTLVFTRTKHGANRVAKHLVHAGVGAVAIHGNKSQSARERALEAFRDGSAPVLVATDIAARGLDVDGVSHVVNFDLPNIPETYVHRIGRTARAGREGIALSFCDVEERDFLRDIEKLIRRRIPAVDDHPFAGSVPAPQVADAPRQGRGAATKAAAPGAAKVDGEQRGRAGGKRRGRSRGRGRARSRQSA